MLPSTLLKLTYLPSVLYLPVSTCSVRLLMIIKVLVGQLQRLDHDIKAVTATRLCSGCLFGMLHIKCITAHVRNLLRVSVDAIDANVLFASSVGPTLANHIHRDMVDKLRGCERYTIYREREVREGSGEVRQAGASASRWREKLVVWIPHFVEGYGLGCYCKILYSTSSRILETISFNWMPGSDKHAKL